MEKNAVTNPEGNLPSEAKQNVDKGLIRIGIVEELGCGFDF